MEQLWYTQQTDYLSQLGEQDRDHLLQIGNTHRFKKNELIFHAGSPGDYVYLLTQGRAKIYQHSPSGKEVILWFCFSGEMFGMAEVCLQGQREVYARACSDTEVIKVSQQSFKKFLATHSEAAMLTIDLLSCRLRILGDMLLNLASDDVMSRLVKLLTRLSSRYGKLQGNNIILDIPLTHQEMADMIGASRQTVSSAISQLTKEGFVKIEKHCIHIKNSDSLINFANKGQAESIRKLAVS